MAQRSSVTTTGDRALDELVSEARDARRRAYAPYSGYEVGAAVRTSDGAVHGGCNVENAMFGASVCAERVAIWRAVSAGARRITALAVVTRSGGAPCGFCRQVLWEFAEPDALVVIAMPDGVQRVTTIARLLPDAWDGDDLDGVARPAGG